MALESKRDTGQLGELLVACDEVGSPLARLADQVRLVGRRAGWPVRPAARHVLAELGRHAGLSLFVLQPGEFARPVGADDVWRPRFASGVELVAQWDELGKHVDVALWSLPDDENAARGIVIPDGEHPGMGRAELVKLPELPELRGAPGALDWLRLCWVERATTFDALDEGAAAGLAILQADAVRLFGDALAPAQGLAVLAADSGHESSEPDPPSDDRRFDAVAALRKLESSETKGARAKVAATYSVSARTVGKWVEWVEANEAKKRSDLAQGQQYKGLQVV